MTVALLLGLMMSCNPDIPDQYSGRQCTNSVYCPDGELCKENRCIETECISSNDCDLEEYCDANNACQTGCQTKHDCLTGDQCNTDTAICEADVCRNSMLDCEIGQYCDPDSQQCVDDEFPHCAENCTLAELQGFENFGGECIVWDILWDVACTDVIHGTGCPSDTLICMPGFAFDPNASMTDGICVKSHRLKTCSIGDPTGCPRGFICYEDIFENNIPGLPSGMWAPPDGSQVNACVGYCSYLIEYGLLD